MRAPAELQREERAEQGTASVEPTNGQMEPSRHEQSDGQMESIPSGPSDGQTQPTLAELPDLIVGVAAPAPAELRSESSDAADGSGRASQDAPAASRHRSLVEEVERLRAQLSALSEQVHQRRGVARPEAGRSPVRLRDNLEYARRLPRLVAKALIPLPLRAPIKKVAKVGRRAYERVIEELVERPTWAFTGFAERLALRTLKATKRIKSLWDGTVVWPEPWPLDAPLVSVIIPCFNYGHFLDDALQSLYRQTLSDFEIIIVEGGSTDGFTVEKVRAIKDPRVTKIFQTTATPVGGNRLRGLRAVRGKYVVFLDPDDMLDPTYLEKAVMALELTGVDIAYSSVQLFGRENWIWETAVEFTLANLAELNTIPTVAMFRLRTWKRLQIGYPTDPGISGIEDWDFWLRFAERGARGIKIREPLMLYRVHGKSLTDAVKQREDASKRKILAEHRGYLGPRRLTRISRLQRELPEVRQPLLNLSRIERASEEPLRIALALPWLIVGGSDSLMLQVFSDFQAFNASLCVYATLETPKSMGSSAAEYRKLTDDFFDLPNELPSAVQSDAIVHLLKSRRSNLLLIVGSAMTYDLLPRLRKELPGLRVVDHLYNTIGHLPNNRRYADFIDFHIVANDEVKRALLKAGEPSEKVKIIRHGIDMDRYSPSEVVREERGWNDLPIPDGGKLVLYAGRFSEEKGVLRFVEIVQALRAEAGLVFAMTGDGPQRQLVEFKLKQLGLEHRVRLLGIVPDASPFLRRADVVVIPSDIEGLPLVCLEALALGTPVVASKLGGVSKVITPGVTGYLAEPRRVDSFVDAIRRALSLDPDRAHLANVCRSSVVNRFGISKVRAQYFDIFRGLTSETRAKTRSGG